MSRPWVPLVVLIALAPLAAAQGDGHVDGHAPLDLHGDLLVEAPGLRLYHHASATDALAGTVYRGVLYEVSHPEGGEPQQRVVRQIDPSQPADFRFEPGAIATAEFSKGLRFQVAPTGLDTNETPTLGPVAHAGPNPAQSTALESDGPDDPWATVPAYPTSAFLVAPSGGLNTTSPLTVTLHAGNLTLTPSGQAPAQYQARVVTQTSGSPGPLPLPPDPSPEYEVAVSYVLNMTLAVTSLRSGGADAALAHWTGSEDATAPSVDAAAGHWPRDALDSLAAARAALGVPATVLAADNLTLSLDGVARLHDVVDPQSVGAAGVEPGDTLELGGDLILQPVAPGEDARRFRLLVAGRVDHVGPGPADGDEPWRDVALWGGVGLVAAVGTAWAWPAIKFGAARYLLVPLYARIHREEVLEHPVRDDILSTVSQEPGISASELGRRTQCGWGTLVYHLSVLEREKMVWSAREGRHRRYFAQGGVNYSDRDAIGLLRNTSSRRLADAVRASPGIIQKDLSRILDLSPSTVAWHVERLEGAGLVLKEADGRQVRYYPSGRLDDLVRQVEMA